MVLISDGEGVNATLHGMDVRGVDHLLAGQAHRGLLAGVLVDDARLLVAVQVEPAAHVVGLDEVLRHRRLADERLHAADHALAGDARLEEDVVQVELELLGPVARRDVDAHRLGEVVDAEHDVLHRRVLHQLGGDLERLGVLDDRLDGDAVVEPHEDGGEIADLGGAVGLARLGEHHHVEVIGQVADQREVLLVLLGAERVDAHRDLHFALRAAGWAARGAGVRGSSPSAGSRPRGRRGACARWCSSACFLKRCAACVEILVDARATART